MNAAAAAMATTSISLDILAADEPGTYIQLAIAALDRSHVMAGDTAAKALEIGILLGVNPDGTARIHDDTRAAIIALTDGQQWVQS